MRQTNVKVMSAATVIALALAGPAAAQWQADVADSRARAEGRGVDQAANPAYHAAQQPYRSDPNAEWIDPFRRDWSGRRGVSLAVRFGNRYGAKLAGHLYRPMLPWTDPITGRARSERLPAVVLLPGLGNWDTDYAGMAQQLAENGYVVLSVEPQGQHLSEADPSPRDAFCGEQGEWREPAEAGLTERGTCAGQDPPAPPDAPHPALDPLVTAVAHTPARDAVALATIVATVAVDPEGALSRARAAYEYFRARFTFAGIDAGRWLVSDGNPWQDLIDPRRIGIAGHSAGGDGAVVAGNADFDRRFRAAVAWDSFGEPPEAMQPRVPTMFQVSEQAPFMVHRDRPDPELWASYDVRDRFDRAGVETFLLALRGSSHQEWHWMPDAATKSFANASARGHQVALYYTVAWFDRWLKGHGSPATAADARRRLTANRFDGSADRTSIGSGTYDPIHAANVPYRIGGDPVTDHLSRLYRSSYAFDGARCADVVGGC